MQRTEVPWYQRRMKLARISLFLLALSATLVCCKKSDDAKVNDNPKAAAKTDEVKAAEPKMAEPGKPAAVAAGAAADVDLKQFITDKSTAPELDKVYPAGKPFRMSGVLKEAPKCEDSGCSIQLSDGKKTYSSFDLAAADKAKLAGKAAGAAVSLTCNPVYEGGSMQIAKSCTVD